ncbi:MAG: hypothetical protein JWN22_2688 [Nocardioides sp.]|jgi:hypothetical protein|nr:hypothetical protein [Nocardioides sp.]
MKDVPRVLLLPLLAIVLGASGCGSDDRPVTDLAGPPMHAREHRGTTPEATPTPSRTRPATPAQPHRPRTTRPKLPPLIPLGRDAVGGHFLDADRMPVLAAGIAWTTVDEGPEDTQRVGACQKTSLESIGALNAVRRTYAAAGDGDGAAPAHAVQVVARFADDKSAWRAHEVLRSWREDCEQRLDLPRTEVGPLEAVAVRVGTGDSYRTVYGSGSGKRVTAAGLGIVRTGSYLSLVEITTTVDAYPAGRDPARVAVRRIARTFG